MSEGAGTGAAWKAPEDRAAPNLRTFLLAQSRRLKRHPNPHPAQPRGARDGARPWLLARSPAHSPAHSRSAGLLLLGWGGRARSSPQLSRQVFERFFLLL